ncbi:MAG: DUF882 domain-containing protein [Deltaproteobacteria bacterium]|nr:MAG: DUF882 domain-containing protein [Deltaproteobacteria bacterium]
MFLQESRSRVLENSISRRGFLKLGMLAFAAGIFPCPAFATIRDFLSPERSLAFLNIHTGENLETVYWSQGKYLPEALVDIKHILRDHRTDEMKPIDTRLLDLLYAIRLKLDARDPFHIISGYRSPSTNALLHKQGGGVAKNSLHIYGKAADISLPGCELDLLRRTAIDLRAGGVGYYAKYSFVHVDVGRVRYW